MEKPSEKVKQMTMGKFTDTYSGLICPIHNCPINTCELLSISWCPECIKACDENERHYFEAIHNPASTPLQIEATLARRKWRLEQGEKDKRKEIKIQIPLISDLDIKSLTMDAIVPVYDSIDGVRIGTVVSVEKKDGKWIANVTIKNEEIIKSLANQKEIRIQASPEELAELLKVAKEYAGIDVSKIGNAFKNLSDSKMHMECFPVPHRPLDLEELEKITDVVLEKEIEIKQDIDEITGETCCGKNCHYYQTWCFEKFSKTIVHDNYHEYESPSDKCPGAGKYRMTLTKINEEIKKEESENE